MRLVDWLLGRRDFTEPRVKATSWNMAVEWARAEPLIRGMTTVELEAIKHVVQSPTLWPGALALAARNDPGVVMCDCETCQGRVPARPGALSSAEIIARAYERLGDPSPSRAGNPHPFLREPTTEESLGQAAAYPAHAWFDEDAQEEEPRSDATARSVQHKGMTLDLVDRTARTPSGVFAFQEMADRLFRDYDEDQALRRAAGAVAPARDCYRMHSVEELLDV